MSTVSTKPIVVVTGANRGLGYEYVKQILQAKHGLSTIPTDAIVVATARNVDKADALKDLQQEYKDRLDIVTNDVSDKKSNEALVNYVTKKYGRADLLLLNAGIGPTENIDNFNRDHAVEAFVVNAVGPTEQTQLFLPLLKATQKLKTEEGTKVDGKGLPAVKVVFFSTVLSSLGALDGGYFISYRASKAALNMFARSAAADHKDIGFLILHPGWVDTDMGRIGGKPPLDPPTAISHGLKRIDELTLEKSGSQLVSFDGSIIAW